jgi:hypothetical protein
LLREHFWPPPVADAATPQGLAWEEYAEQLAADAGVTCELQGDYRHASGYAELAADPNGGLGPGQDVDVVDSRLYLGEEGLGEASRARVTLQGLSPFEITWRQAEDGSRVCTNGPIAVERSKTRAYGLVQGIPEGGCAPARVEGCGNRVEIHLERGYMMTVPTRACSLQVRVGSTVSEPVAVQATDGEATRVDLAMPDGAAELCVAAE